MVKKEKDHSTQQKILDAAREVFLERGLDGARMQDIADKAGINKALLHYYFRNKEKLFELIFAETAGKLFPQFERILDSDMDLFEKIRALVSEYISTILQNPYLPLFVMNELNKNQDMGLKSFFASQKKGFFKKFAALLEENVRQKTIRPIQPGQLLIHLFSLCAFPFIARPMIGMLMGVTDQQFKQMMEERKVQVAEFIIHSIKK